VAGLITSALATAPASATPDRTSVEVVVAGRGSATAVERAVERHGGVVTGRLDIVDGVTAAVPAAALARLELDPAVSGVTRDLPVTTQGNAEDAPRVQSAYLEATGASKLHRAGVTGAGVTVALIDTGVADVPDLAGRIRTVTDAATGRPSPCVDLSGEGHCRDSYGHGTFMAGIIAGDGAASGGRFTGMAPGADLVSIKVAGRDGSSDVSKVLAAIQWAVVHKDEHGIGVINLSLGTDSTQTWEADPFNYAVQRAWDAGITVVVAASNMGPAPGTIAKPGDDPWVLTVGAVDDHGTPGGGDDRLPDFSSRGPTAHGLAKPDVVAPGAHVVSLRAPGSTVDEQFPGTIDGTYRSGSGTSMAAAAVSGGVALLLEQHAGWGPDQVKQSLRGTARPTASTDVMAVGAGSIDLPAASGAGAQARLAPLGRSSGLGPLHLSRGNVRVRTDSLLGTVLGDLPLTAQLLLWDPIGFTTGDWRADTWRSTSFVLNRWYRTSWHGNNWQGNNWQGNNWQGNNWQGDWQGSTSPEGPRPGDHYGRPWLGAAWYGLWE
jgi:serine protease AprX